MLPRKHNHQNKKFACLSVAAAAFVLSACGSGEGGAPRTTSQGTVSLDSVKVGLPESVFKDSVLTFVPKEKAPDSKVTEYMSRTFNKNGGQVVAQCQDDQCGRIMVFHVEKPISKAAAEETMKALLPAVAGESPKSNRDKNDGQKPIDKYEFEGGYKGSLLYSDNTAKEVIVIAASVDKKAGQGDGKVDGAKEGGKEAGSGGSK